MRNVKKQLKKKNSLKHITRVVVQQHKKKPDRLLRLKKIPKRVLKYRNIEVPMFYCFAHFTAALEECQEDRSERLLPCPKE